MPSRPRPKAPKAPDPNEGVFDTAAPPPPAPLRRGRPAKVPSLAPGPARPPVLTAPPVGPAAAGAATRGPWCTCGLGGNLLAQNAVLFWILTGLTYAVGLWLLAYLVLFLYLAWLLASCGEACSQACGSCTCQAGSDDGSCCCPSDGSSGDETGNKETPGGTAVGVVTGLASALTFRGRLAARPDFAHHPDLPEFRQDVWRLRGVRVCVGCSVVYPAFLAATAGFELLPLGGPWVAWVAGGLGLAAMQAVSSLGWARIRATKATVKACLGTGLAAYLHGVLAAPWPHLVQGAALTAIVALAGLSAMPRRRRIRAALAARA